MNHLSVDLNESTPPDDDEDPVHLRVSHQNFISLVAAGVPYGEAYQKSISRKASANSCYAEGSRLAKRYSAHIESALQKRQTVFNADTIAGVRRVDELQLLSHVEIAEFLSGVISGKRGMNGDPNGKATYSDLLKAMELYMKLTGGWPPFEKQNTIDGTETIVIKAATPPAHENED